MKLSQMFGFLNKSEKLTVTSMLPLGIRILLVVS